jgi:hypothetical protein
MLFKIESFTSQNMYILNSDAIMWACIEKNDPLAAEIVLMDGKCITVLRKDINSILFSLKDRVVDLCLGSQTEESI